MILKRGTFVRVVLFKLSEIEADLRFIPFSIKILLGSIEKLFVNHLVFHWSNGCTWREGASCGTCSYQTYISLNVRTANRTHADTCISRPSVVRFPRYLIPCASNERKRGRRRGGFKSKALKEKSKNREIRETISSLW